MEIKRNQYLQQLIDGKGNHLIKIITGLRRCGKSYLLFNLFPAYLQQNGVPSDHIIKIDLEDIRNTELRSPLALVRYIDKLMTDEKMHYILLDEIQHVEKFEEVLNSYLKIKNADIYVTGSNSKFLSSDIVTEFRGRGDEIHMHPLSFAEYYSAVNRRSHYFYKFVKLMFLADFVSLKQIFFVDGLVEIFKVLYFLLVGI